MGSRFIFLASAKPKNIKFIPSVYMTDELTRGNYCPIVKKQFSSQNPQEARAVFFILEMIFDPFDAFTGLLGFATDLCRGHGMPHDPQLP